MFNLKNNKKGKCSLFQKELFKKVYDKYFFYWKVWPSRWDCTMWSMAGYCPLQMFILGM